MATKTDKQTFGFQTEVKQLLHLMIHSLYSHKEIFLRELISNASDAVDKLRFSALKDSKLLGDDSDLKITITTNAKKKTLTISDNGIGMNRDDVIENLGTIAKSGTQQFIQSLTGDQAKDSKLIGQFGVGFYSAFMAADKVTVLTRKAGEAEDQAVRWESKGDGEYTVEDVVKASRGTEITLHLNKDSQEFTEAWQVRNIVTKYSDHIDLPIYMEKAPEYDEAGKQKPSTGEMEVVNKAKALWTRAKSEITDEEYQEFYKHVSHDFAEPMSWIHNHVEGKTEYTSLFYIPANAPFDLYDREMKSGIKLYVQRVFIMDNADVLPNYLRFVKGVLDSNDLPLNVSREILQSNAVVDKIKAASVKKILSTLSKMAKNKPEQYAKFWAAFGQVIKEGIAEDHTNKDTLAKLLRFYSTNEKGHEPVVSLDDYVSRMTDKQDKIYYVTADSLAAAKNSPHLEVFRQKGIEVLLLGDRVDEWMVANITEYEGKQLQSISKGALDLENFDDEVKKEEKEAQEKDYESVLKQVKEVLGDQVKEVRLTYRLTDSPACVVADEHGMSMHLQRMMASAGQAMPAAQATFELNPAHPFVQNLKSEQDDAQFANWSHFLFEEAMLAESGKLEDPAAFIKRVNALLEKK